MEFHPEQKAKLLLQKNKLLVKSLLSHTWIQYLNVICNRKIQSCFKNFCPMFQDMIELSEAEADAEIEKFANAIDFRGLASSI